MTWDELRYAHSWRRQRLLDGALTLRDALIEMEREVAALEVRTCPYPSRRELATLEAR